MFSLDTWRRIFFATMITSSLGAVAQQVVERSARALDERIAAGAARACESAGGSVLQGGDGAVTCTSCPAAQRVW